MKHFFFNEISAIKRPNLIEQNISEHWALCVQTNLLKPSVCLWDIGRTPIHKWTLAHSLCMEHSMLWTCSGPDLLLKRRHWDLHEHSPVNTETQSCLGSITPWCQCVPLKIVLAHLQCWVQLYQTYCMCVWTFVSLFPSIYLFSVSLPFYLFFSSHTVWCVCQNAQPHSVRNHRDLR